MRVAIVSFCLLINKKTIVVMLLEIKPLTSVFMELKNKIQNVPGDIFLRMNPMSVAYFGSHMMIEK